MLNIWVAAIYQLYEITFHLILTRTAAAKWNIYSENL